MNAAITSGQDILTLKSPSCSRKSPRRLFANFSNGTTLREIIEAKTKLVRNNFDVSRMEGHADER